MSRLDLSPLGLVWLGSSLGGIFSIWSEKPHEIYRKRAPIPAKFEVEHDFSKTHVPREILNFGALLLRNVIAKIAKKRGGFGKS